MSTPGHPLSHNSQSPPLQPHAIDASPRTLIDVPIEAFAAIVVRHLGADYIAPRAPAICEGWVADFKQTFDNPGTRPIETVFKADPMMGPQKFFDAVREGEASWPLFAIWRTGNQWSQWTNGVDKNRVTVKFCWVLPPHENTERNWPLLTVFDFHLRRILKGTFRCAEDRELLKAASVMDLATPWQTYTTEQGYKGPGGKVLYPTLSGSFQFDIYWAKSEENYGLLLPAFNRLYVNYTLRARKESGSMYDVRLMPPLSSAADPILPGQGNPCPPP